MTSRFIRDMAEFKKISGEWDKALVASGEDNPFLLSDFIAAWWNQYGREGRLRIFVMEEAERVVAGMPLYIGRELAPGTASHVGAQAANLTHFFSVDKGMNFMKGLAGSLLDSGDFGVIVLDRVIETHPVVRDLPDAAAALPGRIGYALGDAGLNGAIDLQGGYDAVMATVSRRIRQYLRSSADEIRRLGGLRLERVEGPEAVERLFTQYRLFSVKSFSSRRQKSAFEDPRYGLFFGSLLKKLAEKGMLDAHRLLAGDDTLAISFGYRFGAGFKWVLTAFNPEFQDLRPGHLLIDELVREAIARGDPYFDMFYGGDAFYKQQWCNKMIPLKRVYIYKDIPLCRLSVFLEKKVREMPAFMAILKRLRALAIRT